MKSLEPLGPLIYEEDYIVPLLSSVLGLMEKDVIKDPESTSVFRVFTCRKENKPNKRPRRIQKLINQQANEKSPSIILSSDSGDLMLQVSDTMSRDHRKRLYLGVKPYRGNRHTLHYHGCVHEHGVRLIFLAIKLLDRLSYMFRYQSQCHHFVPKYLTLLGIGHHSCFNDCERILLVADGTGAAEIFQHLYEKQKNSDSVFV